MLECQDCGRTIQISPRGELQGVACPNCGGQRMFRMQPNPVQSEGTIRNMPEPGGEDPGGNPSMEGILAPSHGDVLSAFMDEGVRTCDHCGWNTRLQPGETACPKCHWPFEDDLSKGIPAELRPEIAGAPLTEGSIMQTEHTDPYDTGAHGRDEYTHGHVIAALVSDLYKAGPEGYELSEVGRDRLRTMLQTMRDKAEQSGLIPQQSRDVLFDPPAAQPTPKCRGCGQKILDWGPHANEHVYECPRCHQQSFIARTAGHWEDVNGEQVYRKDDPMDDMRCPDCHEQVMVDRGQPEAAFCPTCDKEWPIYRDEPWGEQHFIPGELQGHDPRINNEPIKGWMGPMDMQAWGDRPRYQGKVGVLLETDDSGKIIKRKWVDPVTGEDREEPYLGSDLKWTPGMHGRGLIIGGQPHTWNALDPRLVDRGLQAARLGPLHREYVTQRGINPMNVDFNTGIEIRPNGEVEAHHGQDLSPFIEADPRLKEIEGNYFTFNATSMPTFNENSKRELYDSWQHQADVMFDKGPIQNLPAHTAAAQPSPGGIHSRHTTPHRTLAFLDAHINGIPVRTRANEIIARHDLGGQEYNKPVIVGVHHPEHLAAAVEAVENPEGFSYQMNELAPRIQSGEVPPPPGIDAASLQPLPGVFPGREAATKKTTGWLGDALMGAGLVGAQFIPGVDVAVDAGAAGELAAGAGEAAAGAGEAGAGAAADAGSQGAFKGILNKAMNAGGGLAKAEGITGLVNQGVGMGESALGIGGQGGGSGNAGAAPYNGPLQQFTHVHASDVVAALVAESMGYETPSSVPDVGVKHDDPEDVDQKEFNDQDRSPENLLNPNFQDSGNSGEDAVRDKMDKPTQADQEPFNPEGEAVKRAEMLWPLIEKYYNSDEPGINDPQLRALHDMLERESPGYLNHGDTAAAERLMHSLADPTHPRHHVHAAFDPRQEDRRQGPRRWTDQDEAMYQQDLQERARKRAIGEPDSGPNEVRRITGPEALQERRQQQERRQEERRQNPTPITCAACQSGQIVGNACNNCGITVPELLERPTSREAAIPAMSPANLTETQLALDPTGADAQARGLPAGAQNPLALWNRAGVPPEQRRGVDPADKGVDDSTLPGAENQEEVAQQGAPTQWGSIPPGARPAFSHADVLAALVDSANHQGPVTPEQIASVQQWLIQHGRTHEVPNVELDPGNPEYVKILKEIQGEDNVPPTITPEEQTKVQPPQMPPGAGGSAMPVPGMAPGETGGAPMQPMSRVLSFLEVDAHGVHGEPLFPPCPKCGQVAGFEEYPWGHGMLWCKNGACQHIISPKDLGDIYNNMRLQDSADLAMIPETQHPLGHEGRTASEWPNEAGEWPWDVQHEPEVDPETGQEFVHMPPHYPNVLKWLRASLPDPTDPRHPEIQKAIKEHEDYLDHIGYPHREEAMFAAPTVEHPLGPHTGADNIAPRCPKCGSGTTGMVGDTEHHARCHACKNVFKVDLMSDSDYGQSSIASVQHRALDDHRHPDQANPVGVPAAQQEEQQNQGKDQDSSLVWKDRNGEKLVAGQTYEMHNPAYTLPDLIRVERVKPDGIDVTLLGTYANDPTQEDPNRLTSSTPISKEDMELQELTFEPVAQSQEDRGNEPPPGEQAPGLPPMQPTTDEQDAREPNLAHVEDDSCPKCGSIEHTSSMISPEATEHDCYYCGHVWVTEEKTAAPHFEEGEWVNPNAQWLMEDDDAEDLSPRARGMMEASQQSKNIRDLAAKDPRQQQIRAYLEHEAHQRKERLAGRHFTPREQRELIDEDGKARNRDLLDLEGTHYKVRESWDSTAKPERVRDNDLFLGM